MRDECRSLRQKNANQNNFPLAQHMYHFTHSALLQFCSSALLGQSGTPSHSGLTLLIQEVALHWKFPLQFNTGRQYVDDEAWLTVQLLINYAAFSSALPDNDETVASLVAVVPGRGG